MTNVAQHILVCHKTDGSITEKTVNGYAEAVCVKQGLLKKHKYTKIEITEAVERLSERKQRLEEKGSYLRPEELALLELRKACGLPV